MRFNLKTVSLWLCSGVATGALAITLFWLLFVLNHPTGWGAFGFFLVGVPFVLGALLVGVLPAQLLIRQGEINAGRQARAVAVTSIGIVLTELLLLGFGVVHVTTGG